MTSEIEQYAEKIKWFNEARFGVIVHWGLYSLLGRSEWSMLVERTPKEEYAPLADRFIPDQFNPDQWVRMAKEAGAKYMILTTRHHDGFCLFDSKVSDFTSVKTGAKRDFVYEFINACRRQDMKIGLYYSLLDWRFSGYFNRSKNPESFTEMVQQAHDQVRELVSNYGKIDLLWYDGGWISEELESPWYPPGAPFTPPNMLPDEEQAKLWKAKELNDMVREIQPHILINNRSGEKGDFDTPEQYIANSEKGRAWEACMTIGDFCTWGYTKHNPNRKSVSQLIQNLVTCASKEGNFLLNIGPKPDGSIVFEEEERLRAMGQWMRIYSESIYGSENCSVSGGVLGLATRKNHRIYIHVFRWPGVEACIPGVEEDVKKAYILGDGKELRTRIGANGRLFIEGLPENPPDAYNSVIVLEVKDKSKTGE